MSNAESQNDGVGLSVSRGKLESFLPLLGYEVDDEGYIVALESGAVAKSPDGEALTVDEIGYLGNDDGEVVPVKNNFSDIISHLSDRDARDD